MTRILVTGGRGFIGRYAISALQSQFPNAEIHAITSHVDETVNSRRIFWRQCDLMRPREIEQVVDDVQPSHLLHLAWITQHHVYWESPLNEQWFDASCYLVNRFLDVGGRRLVVAGSCAEYDWSCGRCIERKSPLSNASAYARWKNRLSEQIELCCQRAGVSAAWGRVFFAFGLGEPRERLVSTAVTNLTQGRAVQCSAGQHQRDFIYAPDVGAAFAQLLHSPVEGPVNLGLGSAISIADLVNTLGKLTNAIDQVQLGSQETLREEPPLVVADSRRLLNEVGFQPQFDVRVGLEDYVRRVLQRQKMAA